MTMKYWMAAASMAGLIALGGCSQQQEAAALTDDQVETAIKAQFDQDADLRAANLSVDADVDEHEIEISGTVHAETVRDRAVDIAKSYEPGMAVTSKIDVEPLEVPRDQYTEDMAAEARMKAKAAGNSIGDSLDDAWIHTKISSKLATDGDAPFSINVDVDKNVVTLRGDVDTAAEKAEAERIAKETDGVKSVRNMLNVKG